MQAVTAAHSNLTHSVWSQNTEAQQLVQTINHSSPTKIQMCTFCVALITVFQITVDDADTRIFSHAELK